MILKIMNEDSKLYAINATAFGLSFTNIMDVLKVLLLVVSIGYTGYKWFKLMQNDKTIKGNNNDDQKTDNK